MCAIAGMIDLLSDSAVSDRMLQTMERRGPDGQGVYKGKRCTLLHTRLAIIDPVGGQQPMVLEWEGERYILVYNGELYNTDELRSQLETLGHRFTEHSDTEVVLHAYVQWKAAALERMNGIFAFAVWEERAERLFLARDRIGVKPLFYAVHNQGLLFASEIKTILTYPSFKAQLDIQGAAQIVLFGPGRIPGSGVFRGVMELEPGYCAIFQAGKLLLNRYWYLQDGLHSESLEDTIDHVRQLVTDAVTRQMVSDVPVGCFLSGGLDSSIISAICANKLRESGKVLPTFSVDYQGNEKYFTAGKFQPDADGEYIKKMVEAICSNHHATILTSEELFDAMEDATIARDLPGMADVDFSLLAFCGKIREHVKVALSGECADEIFGGYPWYRDPEVRDAKGFPWAQNTEQRVSLMAQGVRHQLDAQELLAAEYDKTLHQSDIMPENSPLEKRMKQMVNLNFRWFMQTLLDRKDRMSMYLGLEVRVPFCDHRIAEYLYRVPWNYKDLRGREKGLLRKSVEGLLPDCITYRKKSPYPKTYHPNYTNMVKMALQVLMNRRNAPIFSLFSREAITSYLNSDFSWPWYGQLMTRPQTMAYFLQVNFWLEHYGIDIVI